MGKYVQTKSFDTRKAGTIGNFCLSNVSKGFGIANKYGSAWDAWLHTQQHKNWDIPKGVDVPLYFSYSAKIDGVYKNWGHAGVQLANGRFWSDGTIYTDVHAYLNGHWPKFVGWGESVNDVKVINFVATPAPAPSLYPKWVKVKTLRGANVRSAPNTTSKLAGSRYLPYGTPFRVSGIVNGENVGGNNKWYKSMYGNYIWTGNIT